MSCLVPADPRSASRRRRRCAKARRQPPALQGPGVIEGPGLAFQEGQVVAGIEGDLLFGPTTLVAGHHLGADHDPHLVDAAQHGDLVMGPCRRHRVVVAVETHEGERVGTGVLDPPRVEGLVGESEHGSPVHLEAPGLPLGLAAHRPVHVGHTRRFQVGVQLGKGTKRRHRREEVPPTEADQALRHGPSRCPGPPGRSGGRTGSGFLGAGTPWSAPAPVRPPSSRRSESCHSWCGWAPHRRNRTRPGGRPGRSRCTR